MSPSSDPLREQVARALDWEDAHVQFSKALAGIPSEARDRRAPGFDHTLWQLLEHLRIALADIVDFARNRQYEHTMTWPDDYWPTVTTPSEQQWHDSVSAYQVELAKMQAMARDESIDLLAPVPTGKSTQTYLRAILLAIDHNAYHVGQLVAVRRALGIWP